MMKYFLIGLLFGLALIKGQATSWFRMQEMFHFESFQIFGFFITAVPTGALCLYLINKLQLKAKGGEIIKPHKKKFSKGTIYGSALFGIGWGLTGVCPGTIYVQIGSGYFISLIILLSALLGTWIYSFFKNGLPA
jgi:uncharacterized membrane protein YedE/YeeE